MSQLRVTCIIPCHNAKPTIQRAVSSALAVGVDMVMVYDDCSSDNSLNTIEPHHKLCKLISITDVRMGVNAARNYLCSLAETGLIIPLDADDELRDVAALREAYQPGTWVYGNYAEHDGQRITPIKGAAPGALPRKNITGVTFLFHKDDWLKVGGYDPDFAYAEDYAFQCALVNAGVQPRYIDHIVYDRYLHPTGNERTAMAGIHWTFYHQMARRKYPQTFAGTG